MKRLRAWLWKEFRGPVVLIAYVHGPVLMLTGFMLMAASYLEPFLGGSKPPQGEPSEEVRRVVIGACVAFAGFLLERWGRRHATAWEGILMGLGYTIGGPLLVLFVVSKDRPEMGTGGIVSMCVLFVATGAWMLRWGLIKQREAVS